MFVKEDENFVYLLAGKQSQVTTDSVMMDYDPTTHHQDKIDDYPPVPPLFGQSGMYDESRTLYKSEINCSSPPTEDTIAFGSPY